MTTVGDFWWPKGEAAKWGLQGVWWIERQGRRRRDLIKGRDYARLRKHSPDRETMGGDF